MKIQGLLIIVSITLLLSCNNQQKIDYLGNEGVKLFENGKIQEALDKFNEIIILDSLNTEAYLRRADCLDLLGDSLGSIESYSKCIEIDPKCKIAYYNRALSYIKMGLPEKAIDDNNYALHCDPENKSGLNNKWIFLNLGILYGQLNQLDKAIDAFSKAIIIDNKYADAYYSRGLAFQLKGENIKAIEDFDKAIEINPDELQYKNSKQSIESLLNK